MDFEEFAKTTVAQTITALSSQDERIADEFRAVERGRVSSGKIVEIEGDIPVGMKMKLDDFAEAISTRLWESVGRANWRNFENARAYVHELKLSSHLNWIEYAKSKNRPPDIPTDPPDVYSGPGWSGWGDWLGTGRISTQLREYQSFEKARAFARSLGLTSNIEWRDYCQSEKRPADIPANPDKTYAETGWAGWGDWLGTGYVYQGHRQYRPFKKARAFARSLGLKSQPDWRAYCRSGKKPADIPGKPDHFYANDGWLGIGDWLGTGTVATSSRQYRSFKKARAFARSLGLKSQLDWRAYCRSGKKPADIPANVDKVYANDGWSGFGDWLGTGTIAPRLRQYRPFETARTFIRSLGLKSAKEWWNYCKSGKKPPDIPNSPYKTYADVGWAGMSDWLGYARNSQAGESLASGTLA
jgi:hypothetical protein